MPSLIEIYSMANLIEKYGKLLDGLYRKTVNKELVWEISSWDEELYTVVGGRRIRLTGGRDANGSPVERIEVLYGDDVIDSFSDGRLEDLPQDPSFHSYYLKMRALRMTATRQAKGADDALDAILDDLSD